MNYIMSLLAGLSGISCPHCGGALYAIDGGAQECACGVLVVAQDGKWRFPGECSWRALPGVAGWAYAAPGSIQEVV